MTDSSPVPTPANTVTDNNLAPFNPSSETAQRQSLALMRLQPNDVLLDLGCGDGRLLIKAVSEFAGLRCVGIEMDSIFYQRAIQAAATQLSVEAQRRLQIRCQDATQVLAAPAPSAVLRTDGSKTTNNSMDDLTIFDATVLYLYLLPRGLAQIQGLLDKLVQHRLARGLSLRVVAYTFRVKAWEPTAIDTSTKSGVPIYLYEFGLN